MEHEWVYMLTCPVIVLEDSLGNPVIISDPDEEFYAKINTVYGCAKCGQPMSHGINTECEEIDDHHPAT